MALCHQLSDSEVRSGQSRSNRLLDCCDIAQQRFPFDHLADASSGGVAELVLLGRTLEALSRTFDAVKELVVHFDREPAYDLIGAAYTRRQQAAVVVNGGAYGEFVRHGSLQLPRL